MTNNLYWVNCKYKGTGTTLTLYKLNKTLLKLYLEYQVN